MGFREEKDRLLQELGEAQAGTREVLHDARPEGKNLLATLEVTIADVAEIARRARGQNYQAKGVHHQRMGAKVHELKNVRWQEQDWYLKWYFVELDLFFISVHPKEDRP